MRLDRFALVLALVPATFACKSKEEPTPAQGYEYETQENEALGSDFNRGPVSFDQAYERREKGEIERSGDTATSLGADPHQNRGATDDGLTQNDSSALEPPVHRSAVDQANESNAHFNQTEHASTVARAAVSLSSSDGKDTVVGTARLLPRADGDARLVVEVERVPRGSYDVQLGGDCVKDQTDANSQEAAIVLGRLEIGADGRGKLITTLEDTSLVAGDEQVFAQKAVTVRPAKKARAEEKDAVACGMISVPEGEGRG